MRFVLCVEEKYLEKLNFFSHKMIELNLIINFHLINNQFLSIEILK